jgi:hypothetical protein
MKNLAEQVDSLPNRCTTIPARDGRRSLVTDSNSRQSQHPHSGAFRNRIFKILPNVQLRALREML